MKKQIIFIFTIITLITIGCSKENDLESSVFVYDTDYTELPAYSEWGYNTFGAYYDRQVFISNNKIVPVKTISSNGEFSFSLNGQINDANSSYIKREMEMKFTIPGFSPQVYSDLIILNDSTFDLSSALCHLKISMDTTEISTQNLSGELYFKRAQKLYIDNKLIEVILSGYFNVKMMVNNKPITISQGRFDVGISDNNFYLF